MEGPLPASPGTSGMDEASLIIKNAMTVDCLHLDGRAGHPPVFRLDLFAMKVETLNHLPLVVFIE